ncbi:transcription factor bHLH162-like [Humulus lupulus]|uniref:transcription factor bHLH162-like n=1 Tax=Humulus lupulus TaxID=3486 RepID=UPI002B40843E|nr:transcription factor bHLH162-like [Humulus lupulus]
MDLNPISSRTTTDMKTIERNRRNQMKVLYSKLNSLVPQQTTRKVTSLPDQLDEAATYIKKLQISIERMKEKRNRLMGYNNNNNNLNGGGGSNIMSINSSNSLIGEPINGDMSSKSPHIEVHEMGLAVEIVLISGLDFQFMFNETIRILYEEGVDILNASFFVSEDTVFHTIHSQKGEFDSGVGASRISERLKKLIDEASNES